MVEIQVSGLQKSFQVGQTVLEDVTFQIQQGERVGLLGKNGAGKTTLFRLITGELAPDRGSVTVPPGRRVGLISQIPVYPPDFTAEQVLRSAFDRIGALSDQMQALEAQMARGEGDGAALRRYGQLRERFEALGGYDTDVALEKTANGLSIPPAMRAQRFERLSGGEKTRVNLGRLILEDTDILLLDEPTNHLDLRATQWLEGYLQRFPGTVVTISHDRYFLDRTVRRIIELQDGHASFYSGDYSFYCIEKERRFQEQMRRYEKEQAKIRQLEKAAAQLRVWAFMGMDKTYRRAVSMERRIERMRTTEKAVRPRRMDARFTAAEFHGDEVLLLRRVSKSFGEKTLFDGITLKMEGGERIALLGENGAGKSTLMKLICGEWMPDGGSVRLGPQVRLGYLPQTVTFEDPGEDLVQTVIGQQRGLTVQSARDRLAAFDFRGEDVFKPVSALSGGERSRLKLCMLMDGAINLLLLDEPTNHLDIASREWIETAVEAYDGALLFVSHDRYFIRRFATRIWEIGGGTVTDYPMGFEQYCQVKAQEAEQKDAPSTPVKEKALSQKPGRGSRGPQAARRQLERCEGEIARAEAALSALEGEMEQAGSDYQRLMELTEAHRQAQGEIEALYQRWEALAQAAETE